jgi:hypothetical protein
VVGDVDRAGIDRDRPQAEPERPFRQAGQRRHHFLDIGDKGREIAGTVENRDAGDEGIAKIVENRIGQPEQPHGFPPSTGSIAPYRSTSKTVR